MNDYCMTDDERQALTLRVRQLEKEYAAAVLSQRLDSADQALKADGQTEGKSADLFLADASAMMNAAAEKSLYEGLEAKDAYEKLCKDIEIDRQKVEDAAAEIFEGRKAEIAQSLAEETGFAADVLANAQGAKAVD